MTFPFVVGQAHSIEVAVTEQDVAQFAAVSGDTAPMHVDGAFARRHGFDGAVVHGALIAGFVSRLVGLGLPGPLAVLERMELAFRAPCYAPCGLVLEARVRQVSEAVRSMVVDVSVRSRDGRTLVTGKTWHRLLEGESA